MAAFFKVGWRDQKLIFRDMEFPLHLARPMRLPSEFAICRDVMRQRSSATCLAIWKL
ncbi:hypothetical protein RLEG3_07995 (plasmid) [Rhizobium leguminosarum bv. trifolii WSM1689]|nr:hypothetical protein RLEG3_07995 [Rhizobium leguminosarum bv. trifolii WSM1689]